MKDIVLDSNFISSINFFDNILFLNSFEQDKIVYNMVVNYLKREKGYLLKLNILERNNKIIETECILDNKKNGGVVINDIIKLVTDKYNSDVIIDVKESDMNNNCIKFGRRTYNGRN